MELLCGAQANAFGASHLPLGDHVHGFGAADKDARATEIFEPVGCLLIDEDGIYDPRQPNDRLLLGMKGTLSEMELSTFRQRSQAALDQKAKRGELFTSLPIGYLRAQGNRIEKDPDVRIREALDLAFRKFREFGSVRQLLLWIRQERIELPAVKSPPKQNTPRPGELEGARLTGMDVRGR